MRILTFTLMLGFVLAGPAFADTKQNLSEVKERLEAEQAQKQELKKKLSAATGELESSRKSLVSLSSDLQGNEKKLSTLEDRMKKAQAEEITLNAKLQADYGSMGNLILALERIRRMPTETLIIRPGAPLETAQSAILLKSILPAINARAENMTKDLKKLQSLQEQLIADKGKAIDTTAKLKTQQKEIQVLLDKREGLYKQSKSAYEIQAEAVARTAAEAQSLEQLVTRIQEAPAEKIQSRRLSGFRLGGGRWTVPVQGKTVIRFGQRDEIGATSEGLRIAGRAGGLVTAPVGGVVRYAGPFKNYGNMVIIEHDNELHSLLAGLSRIDARVGQKISAGEPIGSLPATGAEGPPTLYYELRHNGKPVDPSAKFPDLS